MADISLALDVLRDAISQALYPGGVPNAPRPASVAGGPVRVYVGWPGNDLDADLGAGVTHVTLWPRSGVGSVFQYLTGWQDLPPPAPSLTAMASGDSVTFAGTSAVPRMIAAVKVDGLGGATFTKPVSGGDGPESIAAAFAAGISSVAPASSSGAVLTVPGRILEAEVVAGGTQVRELRRQRQGIIVTVWAPTQALRDAVAIVIDSLFERTRTFPAPDGTKVSVWNDGTAMDEAGRQHPLRRRDLLLNIEFSMTETAEVEPILSVLHPTVLIRV